MLESCIYRKSWIRFHNLALRNSDKYDDFSSFFLQEGNNKPDLIVHYQYNSVKQKNRLSAGFCLNFLYAPIGIVVSQADRIHNGSILFVVEDDAEISFSGAIEITSREFFYIESSMFGFVG